MRSVSVGTFTKWEDDDDDDLTGIRSYNNIIRYNIIFLIHNLNIDDKKIFSCIFYFLVFIFITHDTHTTSYITHYNFKRHHHQPS